MAWLRETAHKAGIVGRVLENRQPHTSRVVLLCSGLLCEKVKVIALLGKESIKTNWLSKGIEG